MSGVVDTKEAKAWDLRLAGRSWSQVASTMGYRSASAAAGAVRAWQRRSAYLIDATDRVEMLSEEVARLDVLQSAVWNDALMGDPLAVQTALKIIQCRSRLLGLEQQAEAPVNATVVVTGDTGSYVKALRSVTS